MTDALGDPKDEYKVVSDNLRWYSNVRLAQLTLFFAVLAVLTGKAFGSEAEKLAPAFILAMKLLGLFFSVVFLFLEHRADKFWSHFMKRAVELESILGYEQYTTRPKAKFRTTWPIKFLFLAITLFWLATICLNQRFQPSPKVGSARSNPQLNSDPACAGFRSFSSFRYLGFVHRLGAGVAG